MKFDCSRLWWSSDIPCQLLCVQQIFLYEYGQFLVFISKKKRCWEMFLYLARSPQCVFSGLVQRHAIAQNLMTGVNGSVAFILFINWCCDDLYKNVYQVILESYSSSQVKSRVIGSQVKVKSSHFLNLVKQVSSP